VSSPRPVTAGNVVRDAGPRDAPDIARIQVSRWQSGYRELVPPAVLAELTSQDAQERWREHWAASLSSPPSSRHRVLVAVAASGPLVAGFASFGPGTDSDRWPATDAELYELCVAPGQAGRGHGGRLLNAAAAAMADDGFATVCAWVLEQDAAASRFLRAAGWAPDGARRTLDMGTPVAMIRLHTALGRTEGGSGGDGA
jgi:ribosomal protein S18 acetylase RimI-like enzyme